MDPKEPKKVEMSRRWDGYEISIRIGDLAVFKHFASQPEAVCYLEILARECMAEATRNTQ